MGELSGKVAIVTGASKGIGAAIALRFGEAGAAVAVNYSSDKDGADRIVDQIKRDGGKAVAIQANVSKSADVKRLFAETKAKLGAPSILVNNAGVFSFQPLEAVTEEEFHRQFDTNVLGTLLELKRPSPPLTEKAAALSTSARSRASILSRVRLSIRPRKRCRRHHQGVGEGAGRPQNPCQRHCAGHDGDGGR